MDWISAAGDGYHLDTHYHLNGCWQILWEVFLFPYPADILNGLYHLETQQNITEDYKVAC